MKKVTTDAVAEPAADQREVPTPPGGGSWRFDRTKWEWVSSEPAPEPAEPPKE